MQRFRLLDLCCCAGAASVGYHRTGFEVVGVDIEPRPHYPFEFWQRDALTLTYDDLMQFDAIHASPPCQGYCTITASARKRGKEYPDLYAPIKAMLVASGLPYVIENVPGSPLRGAVGLCGTMFGLGVMRHRLFESNVPLALPLTPCTCKQHRIGEGFVTVAGDLSSKADAMAGMRIDWPMSKWEVNQSIPPAYTEFVGRQLIAHLRGEVRAVPQATWRRNLPNGYQMMLF